MDFIVFSHLRWDFVYQRPQHLLSRAALHDRVFFWEEPVFGEMDKPYLDVSLRAANLSVVVPHLPKGLSGEDVTEVQRRLLHDFIRKQQLEEYLAWYYTPMAMSFTN